MNKTMNEPKETERPKTRLTDEDLKWIKDAFADNETLLQTVRNLFFGFELSDDEKQNIREVFKAPEIRRAIKKFVMPEFEPETPVGLSTDMWMSSVDGIKSNSPETLYPIWQSQAKWVEMTETALKLLENPDGEKVRLSIQPNLDPTNLYVDVLARNNFVKTIEQSLMQIKVWAGLKKETVEETRERLWKNSAK